MIGIVAGLLSKPEAGATGWILAGSVVGTPS